MSEVVKILDLGCGQVDEKTHRPQRIWRDFGVAPRIRQYLPCDTILVHGVDLAIPDESSRSEKVCVDFELPEDKVVFEGFNFPLEMPRDSDYNGVLVRFPSPCSYLLENLNESFDPDDLGNLGNFYHLLAYAVRNSLKEGGYLFLETEMPHLARKQIHKALYQAVYQEIAESKLAKEPSNDAHIRKFVDLGDDYSRDAEKDVKIGLLFLKFFRAQFANVLSKAGNFSTLLELDERMRPYVERAGGRTGIAYRKVINC
jgi:hypothetical protein